MMQNKTILVIPDSFKGALSAADTGEAIASGVRHALGERKLTNEVLVFPAADGGEGTAQAVAAAMHGQFRQIAAVDLFDHPMEGVYADLPGDVGEQFAGQITVFRLNVLHDGNQCAVFLAITRDDLIGFAVVRLIEHRIVPPFYMQIPL